jgi:hypothetical protein
LYRRLGLRIALAAAGALDSGSRLFVRPLKNNGRRFRQVLSPRSLLARSAETGTAALLVGTMLAGYLLIYYIST